MKVLYGSALLNEFMQQISSAESRIWICTPYVGSPNFIKAISNGKFLESSIDLRFITDLDELSSLNLAVFKTIMENGELRTLKGVHAKIYIIDDVCLVTSANLTETAFTRRYELGVFLDGDEANKAIDIFKYFWEQSTIVRNLTIATKGLNLVTFDEKFGFGLPKLWDIMSATVSHSYWLKPIGVSEDPVTEDRKFSNDFDELHYAVNPKAVQVGDTIIAYGIGAKRILTVYEAKTLGEKFKDDEVTEEWMNRWSYYMNADNLTPRFGSNWMHHNLYASELIEEYLEINPEGFITFNKSKGLGALNYKKDKIRLDPHFAEFVLNKIDSRQ